MDDHGVVIEGVSNGRGVLLNIFDQKFLLRITIIVVGIFLCIFSAACIYPPKGKIFESGPTYLFMVGVR